MTSKIAVFCGKGGVGKTTLALAYALRRAASGRKAVVVSSHPLHELAVAVSLDGLAARFPEAAKNLFVVHLDPKELLQDLMRRTFPSRMLADRILDSVIYKSLVDVAPGLKEFYFLSRLRQLAERRAAAGGEAPDFELLVWDAPATGHFLSTLRAAQSFETYLTGPLAAAGADVARFFSDSEAISILPVTTLEEMAIQECVEMCRKLKDEFKLAPETVLMNMVSPMATAGAAEFEALAASAGSNPALRFAAARGRVERERAAELKSLLAAPILAIPRIRHGESDIDLLHRAGESLKERE